MDNYTEPKTSKNWNIEQKLEKNFEKKTDRSLSTLYLPYIPLLEFFVCLISTSFLSAGKSVVRRVKWMHGPNGHSLSTTCTLQSVKNAVPMFYSENCHCHNVDKVMFTCFANLK